MILAKVGRGLHVFHIDFPLRGIAAGFIKDNPESSISIILSCYAAEDY